MKPGCFFPALALIAAFCIALASIASAKHMAPVGAQAPEYQAFLALGGADDLCGDDATDVANHDCPFCRLLSDPDDLTPTQAMWLLELQQDPKPLVDLAVHDQLGQRSVTARGPPCAG